LQTFIGSELDTNMAVSSTNVASSHTSAVGASEVNKLYKEIKRYAIWNITDGRLEIADTDLESTSTKKRMYDSC
jgi:hypothetical protein